MSVVEAHREPLSEEAAISIVLDLLAEETGVDRSKLQSDLAGKGPNMPCSSLDILDILVGVEQRTGVKLRADKETARSMRSVRDFARRVSEAANA